MSAMVFAGRNLEMREKMPQTVPSAGFSPPCDYSAFAADCFDLSLLPGSTDSEVPLSPINIQHFLAMYSDPTTPPPMFHSNQDKDFDNFDNFKAMDDDNTNSNKPFSFENFGAVKSTMNSEKGVQNQQTMDLSSETDAFESFGSLKIPLFAQDQSDSNSASVTNVFENFGDLKSTMNQESGLKNPAMTSMNVFEEFRTLKSPPMCQDKGNDSLPGNSYQYHQNSSVPTMLNIVKEEPSYLLTPCMGNYPSPYAPSVSPTPSPSSSYASNLSPYPMSPSQMGIKQEQTLDLQEILEESHFLQESLHSTKQRSTSTKTHDLSQTVANFCTLLMSNPDMCRKKSLETSPLNTNVQNTDEMGSNAFNSGSSSTAQKDDDLMKKSIALGNLLLGCGSSGTIPKQEASTSSCKRGVSIPKLEDHALLREVLKDTSFQRKYNLKPFSFDGLGGFVSEKRPELEVKMEVKMEVEDEEDAGKEEGVAGGNKSDSLAELSREKIEPVLSMAIEQLRKDVDSTCNVLGIAPDPVQWTIDDVKAWLLWTLRQYNLPVIPMEYFNMDGVGLASLTEEDFQQRAPQCGSTLHAQLEIWKAACQDIDTSGLLPWSNTTNSTCSGSSGDISEDDEVESVPSPTVGKPVTARTGGSHIHLWQFLKELLASPQVHGSCIRWLDRTKGVFKIEDSVRVARLWGKRKNRPAMNYDKLSRSIRQYYKKGIMKKTERSQRLVYQFCHPYCL